MNKNIIQYPLNSIIKTFNKTVIPFDVVLKNQLQINKNFNKFLNIL